MLSIRHQKGSNSTHVSESTKYFNSSIKKSWSINIITEVKKWWNQLENNNNNNNRNTTAAEAAASSFFTIPEIPYHAYIYLASRWRKLSKDRSTEFISQTVRPIELIKIILVSTMFFGKKFKIGMSPPVSQKFPLSEGYKFLTSF